MADKTLDGNLRLLPLTLALIKERYAREVSTTNIPLIEICRNCYLLLCNNFNDALTYLPFPVLDLVNMLFYILFYWKWPSSCHVFIVARRKKEVGPLWDRQSQTRWRGCDCWELQDEPFAFYWRIDIACVNLLNRVFSMHLIGFPLRATKQERKSALKRLRYCITHDSQGSVFCKWSEIHCSRWSSSTLWWYSPVTEVGTTGLIHGLVMQTQFCVSFVALWL